jgi:hypothetical protein
MEGESQPNSATRALTTRMPDDPAPLSTLAIDQLIERAELVKQAMKAAMVQGEHYGVIPGTGSRPTLLKPGAEKLCTLFRCAPDFTILRSTETAEEITFVIRCDLIHSPTGQVVGSGIGSCSSRESKYAWRKSQRKCPACGKATIIKGRPEYGGGWVCWSKSKADACGAKFADVDKAITEQPEGRIPNPDLHDQHNTILKMAQKRALIAASLVAFAASDVFTQDLEDVDHGVTPAPPQAQPAAPAPGAKMTDATADAIEAGARAIDLSLDFLGDLCRKRFGHGAAAMTELEGKQVLDYLQKQKANQRPEPAAPAPREPGSDDGDPPWMQDR